MSSSASNENTRRWRDHFFLGGWGFSDTGSGFRPLLRRLRTQKNRNARIASTATTTGTATAACKPGLHEILSQSCSDTVGASPVVLEAASAAVPVIVCPSVGVAGGCEGSVDVSKVVGSEVAASLDVGLLELSVVSVGVADAESVVSTPPVVWANSLANDAFMLSSCEASGPFVPAIPLKAPGLPKSWLLPDMERTLGDRGKVWQLQVPRKTLVGIS
jgi:hypothetical protein